MGIASTIVKNLASETAPTFGKFVEEQPGLFSKLADVVRGTNFGKMDSRQLQKTLLNKGVTVDEVGDTLGGLSGMVTKDQVLGRIGERGIKFEYKILGAPETNKNPVSSETLDKKFEEFFADAYSNLKSVGTYSDLEAQQFAQKQARHNIMRWKDINYPTEYTEPTHFSTWVAPGAKEGSYREMFVTAPSLTKEVINPPTRVRLGFPETEQVNQVWYDGHAAYNNIQNPVVRIRFNDRIIGGDKYAYQQVIDDIADYNRRNPDKDIWYHGGDMPDARNMESGFFTKNINDAIDYAKASDRTGGKGEAFVYAVDRNKVRLGGDIDNPHLLEPARYERVFDINKPSKGKKILFVEEIQGPGGDQKYSFLGPNTDGSKWGSTVHKFDTKEEAVLAAKKIGVNPSEVEKVIEGEQGKMPPALQERIYDIGVKRILAYAKENGYDGVAWTPGKMQADRYSLSNKISQLTYWKNADGTFDLGMKTLEGKTVPGIPSKIPPDELTQYVGKDTAKKILSDELTQPVGKVGMREGGIIKGLDLEIGGEGLKSLYDVRISSLFKKYGKAEVGEINIGNTAKEPASGNVIGKKLGIPEKDISNWWRTLSQDDRDSLIETYYAEGVKVPYIPITPSTPSRYPIYSLAPLFAAGIGANQFGPKYFNRNQPAQPRGF
jgi:hypothetical protein